MKIYVKSLAAPLGGGLVMALFLKALIGLDIALVISLVVFVAMTNIILEEVVETDSAIKRTGRKLFQLALAVLAFIGIRLMAKYYFDMPLADEQADLSEQLKMRNFILELFFLVPGAGLAYAIAYGKVSRKFVYSLACVGFGLILLDVKQHPYASSVKKKSQSWINRWTTGNLFTSLANEKIAGNLWGIVRNDLDHVYGLVQKDKVTSVTLIALEIQRNGVLRLANEGVETHNDQAYVPILIPPGKDSREVDLKKFWIKIEDIEQLDPAKTIVKPDQYVIVRDEKWWRVYFLTDEPIIIDDFPLGRYFMVSGISSGATVECPTKEDPTEFVPFPLGTKVRLQQSISMVLRANKGAKVTVALM